MPPRLSHFLLYGCLWVLLLQAGALRAAEAVAGKAEIRKLLPDDFWASDPADRIQIGGDAIGGAAAPSAFYLAAVEALDKGGAGEPEWMEMSRHPFLCVRVVAMAGLARAGSPAGIARLKELLSSREGEEGMPGGCLSASLWESAIAWHFLTETGFLCCRRKTPLLSETDALRLTLEVLYRDDCAGTRESMYGRNDPGAPARFVAQAVASGRLGLRMDRLVAAAPALKPHQIVKAAGRLQPQLSTPLLLEVLHDGTASPESRLAAASALARQQVLTEGHLETTALRTVRETLDGLVPGRWGSLLNGLDEWEWHKQPALWPETDPKKYGRSPAEAIVARSAWALNLPERAEKKPMARSWAQVAECVRDYAANYAAWRPDWNAFGDTLYRLELRARFVGGLGDREIEPEEARAALLKAVKQALESK